MWKRAAAYQLMSTSRVGAIAFALLWTTAFAGRAVAGDFSGPSTGGQADAADAPGDPGSNPEGDPCERKGDPVSPFTGKWFYRHVDLEVPGIFPIELVRRYDGQTTYQSPLGAGWAFTYDWRLFEYADGSVAIRNACGQVHRYSGAGLTTADAPGWRMSLAADPAVSGGFVLREPRGTRRFFDPQGRMTTIRDPQGNELRFTYGAAKQPLWGTSRYLADAIDQTIPRVISRYYPLQKIEEATAAGALTGRSISFSYDATSGRLVSARSHDGRGVVYTHEMATVGGQSVTTGNLIGVRLETTPGGSGGIVQTFGYTNTTFRHAVTIFQDGAGRRLVKNDYDTQGRVYRQRLGAPPTEAIAFEFDYAPTAFPYTNDFTAACGTTLQCRVVKEHILKSNDDEIALATTAYKFRADGYLLEEIDAAGHRTVNTYDSLRPTYLDTTDLYRFVSGSVGGPATRTLEKSTGFGFDTAGNLIDRTVTVATATGGSETITESWTYDEDWPATHTLVSSALPSNEFRTAFTFERAGLAPGESGYSAADPISNVYSSSRLHFDDTPETTIFGYDENGRLTRVTLPDGHVQVLPRYTAAEDGGGILRNGLVRRRAHESGGVEDAHLKTLFDYDAAGRVATETDARDFATSFAWDALGRLTLIENPLGERTLLTYGSPDGSAEGWQLVRIETGQTAAEGEGRTTKLLYDTLGNLAQVQRKTGPGMASFAAFVTYANDSAGRRISATDAEMHTTTFGWDLLGRLTSATDAAIPANQTTFAYDASGNRTKLTDALTPAPRVTDFVYDALDRLIRIEALGPSSDEITQFAYDAAGNVTKVTDPKNQTTAYGYDALSRLTSVTQALGIATPGEPDDLTVGYAYDGRGRLERVTNARGQILHSSYFAWGGLEKQVYDLDGDGAESGEREVSYTYDLDGHVTSTSDSDAALDFSEAIYTADPSTGYDALGRLHQLSFRFPGSGGPRTLTSTYNRFGERTQLDLTQGAETLSHHWSYDAMGRLDTATFPGSPTPIDFTAFDNDTLEKITRPSGTTTDFTYFPQGPVETITVKAGGTDQISRLAYVVNAVQNITNLSEQHATSDPTHDYVFGYDGANRLQLGDYPAAYGLPPDQRYAYDPAGNRDDADSSWSYLGSVDR